MGKTFKESYAGSKQAEQAKKLIRKIRHKKMAPYKREK